MGRDTAGSITYNGQVNGIVNNLEAYHNDDRLLFRTSERKANGG